MIDALLQQACVHLNSQCLRSSSRLFRLEAAQVAHGFVHDLFIFDPEIHDDSPSTMFFCCTYQSISITPNNFVLNFAIESATSGKPRLYKRLYSQRTSSGADVR